MILKDFLKALATDNVKVNLVKDGSNIISFDSKGYESVESEILENEVAKWTLDGASSITVTIKEVAP